MKKSIITTFLLVFTNLLFANEYEIKTVQEYNNDKNLISIRPSEKVAPQDDETGNRLFINDNGDFFIYNWDKLTTFKLADKQTHTLLHRKHLESTEARAVVQRTSKELR